MGRISEKSRRYRTKDQIIRDLTFVLNAPLSYGTKWAVLRDAAWVWTEFRGKYKGCPYWTKMALMERSLNPKAGFRHEHAVPKSVVMEMLLGLHSPTQEQVRDICERFLIGVVETREEDKVLNTDHIRSMPDEFFDPASPGYQDPWLRYNKDNIEVVTCDELTARLCGGEVKSTEFGSTEVVEVGNARPVLKPIPKLDESTLAALEEGEAQGDRSEVRPSEELKAELLAKYPQRTSE